MAQADQTVQNNTFPTVRADINNNLAALFSKNSGSTAPATTVAYMDWIDTSGANPVWKKRNAANNAWITLGTISGSAIAFEGTLPSQSGQSGKYLTTDGTAASWGDISLSVDVQEFTSNGTWTKPGSGTVALIRCWGGGGSGGRNVYAAGGGGGACVERWMKLSDLGATESVTVGAGGAGRTTNGNGFAGGTTTFGSHVSAFGGGGGGNNSSFNVNGAGGGGALGAGAVAGGAGAGYSQMNTGGVGSAAPAVATGSDWGGGGSGGSGAAVDNGARSTWGGGGGGGRVGSTAGSGGASLNGGAGSAGNSGAAGGFPGGGSGGNGGNTGAGGAGYCIVIVY
jgi:hypothetical protein